MSFRIVSVILTRKLLEVDVIFLHDQQQPASIETYFIL